jgi:ABC-type lipoprotein release transport system permease subunit
MTRLSSSGFWIRIAFLFLYRSGRSTIALSLMLVAAVAALIFLSALAVGITDAMIRNSVSLYSGHITGFALPVSLKPDTLYIKGVADVLRRTRSHGLMMSRDQVETVTLIGIDPAAELKRTAIRKKITAGRFPRNDEQSILLSQPLAETLKMRVGDTLTFKPGFSAAGIRLMVSGIYRTGIDQLDRGIAFCPSEALPAKNPNWTAAVFLDDGVDPATVIAAYRRNLSQDYQFKSWEELMPDLGQLIDLNYLSMGIVTALVFGIVSLGIACAFVIFILKNLREYGIMKAMGVTNREMTLLIIIEVVVMNLAASCIGIFAGVLAVIITNEAGGIDLTAFTSHNRYFTVSGVIFPRLTFFSLYSPPMASFLFCLFAAIWPAVLIARKKAADILRIV